MNKKRNHIIIFSLLLVLTIGAVSVDYVKQLGSIMAQGETPNPGHALNEIAGSETLVRTSGDQTIAGVKTFSNGIKIGSSSLDCTAGNAGAIKYDAGFYGCDGSDWSKIIIESSSACTISPTTKTYGDSAYTVTFDTDSPGTKTFSQTLHQLTPQQG